MNKNLFLSFCWVIATVAMVASIATLRVPTVYKFCALSFTVITTFTALFFRKVEVRRFDWIAIWLGIASPTLVAFFVAGSATWVLLVYLLVAVILYSYPLLISKKDGRLWILALSASHYFSPVLLMMLGAFFVEPRLFFGLIVTLLLLVILLMFTSSALKDIRADDIAALITFVVMQCVVFFFAWLLTTGVWQGNPFSQPYTWRVFNIVWAAMYFFVAVLFTAISYGDKTSALPSKKPSRISDSQRE